MSVFDEFDFEEEFDCDELFDNMGNAEEVVERAKNELRSLFKDGIKDAIEEAVDAKKELAKINQEISRAKYEAERWKRKAEEEKERFEQSEVWDVPKMYLDRIVRHMTGDFAPGDTVYVIEQERENVTCPMCRGEKKVDAVIGGEHHELRCPTCSGYGTIRQEKEKQVVQKKVTDIYLKLCFDKSRVCAWNKDTIFLNGREEYGIRCESIYPTEEAALAAIEEEKDG